MTQAGILLTVWSEKGADLVRVLNQSGDLLYCKVSVSARGVALF